MIGNYIKAATLCGALAVLGSTAQAGISFSSGGSLTNWNGTPAYVSLTSGSGLASATIAQADPTNTAGIGVMSEVFTPTSSFSLASFNILCSVSIALTYQVHLYDLGPAGTVPVSTDASYAPGVDLFNGLKVTPPTNSGVVQASFTLSGADQVSLIANREYALEIWTPIRGRPAGIVWYRNGGSPADPGGQMFTATNSLAQRLTLDLNNQAGAAPCIAALALYAVPGTTDPALAPGYVSAPIFMTNGDLRIVFSGTPFATYVAERADSLNPPVTWIPLWTNVADSYGLVKFTNTPPGPQEFYRINTPAPPPVSNLSATAGDAMVSLSWTASPGAMSYNVKNATTSGGPYATITNITAISFVNTGLSNGTTYYFVVSALNVNAESANSPETNATPMAPPPPAAPTGLTATAANAVVALSWTASSGATSYNVKNATKRRAVHHGYQRHRDQLHQHRAQQWHNVLFCRLRAEYQRRERQFPGNERNAPGAASGDSDRTDGIGWLWSGGIELDGFPRRNGLQRQERDHERRAVHHDYQQHCDQLRQHQCH